MIITFNDGCDDAAYEAALAEIKDRKRIGNFRLFLNLTKPSEKHFNLCGPGYSSLKDLLQYSN